MFYETYDFNEGGTGPSPSSYVDSIIANAGERAKRKRQEETFKQRKEAQEDAKKRKDRNRKKPKAREVRDETLEERNSRKKAAKLARSKNKSKEDGKGAESVISQEQLVEALTVKKGNDKKDSKPAEEESTSSEEDDYDDEPVKYTKREAAEKMDTGDEEEESGGKADDIVPSFYKELNFAYEKNLEVKVAQTFEDEDDARMEIDNQRIIAPETAPISLADSVQDWGLHMELRKNLEKMKVEQFFGAEEVIPSVV